MMRTLNTNAGAVLGAPSSATPEVSPMPLKNTRAHDLVGLRFGRLIVAAREPNRPGTSDAIWLCHCDCGKSNIVRASHLKSGDVGSCGCLVRERVSAAKTTHGMDRTKTYYAWSSIKQRCRNPLNAGYSAYGGRGVDVCDRWHDSFEAFLDDMGVAPIGSSIDRIDNDRGYEPGNCHWATAQQQGSNKRNNVLITALGETHTLSEWVVITGIAKSTIHSRLSLGWSNDDAVSR